VSSIDNRERLVLVATDFNLLFEYSLRGINGFLLQPLLLLILFMAFAKYFAIGAARLASRPSLRVAVGDDACTPGSLSQFFK
jgi:hypothetical protein